jgi:hypothetical protein
MWENLEITRCERFWRRSLVILIVVIILLIGSAIIFVIRSYKRSFVNEDGNVTDTNEFGNMERKSILHAPLVEI